MERRAKQRQWNSGLPSPELREAQTTPTKVNVRLVATDTRIKLLQARAAPVTTCPIKVKVVEISRKFTEQNNIYLPYDLI
jgi:hypothetical protein